MASPAIVQQMPAEATNLYVSILYLLRWRISTRLERCPAKQNHHVTTQEDPCPYLEASQKRVVEPIAFRLSVRCTATTNPVEAPPTGRLALTSRALQITSTMLPPSRPHDSASRSPPSHHLAQRVSSTSPCISSRQSLARHPRKRIVMC